MISAATLSVGTTAHAARVTGAVELPPEESATDGSDELTAFYWEEPNGFFPIRERRRGAAGLMVVLVGNGTSSMESPSQLEIRGGTFENTTFAVPKNAALVITNTDPCNHELFSDDLDTLRASPTPPGGTLEVAVGETGTFTIRDRSHATLAATVHVLDNLVARTQVSSTGSFRFDDVPAGTYTLEVYRGSRKLAATSVTVEDDVELTAPLSLER